MIPPPNFDKGINFIGFQDYNSGSSIIVNEIPASYELVNEAFSKENMSKKGMKLLNTEEYIINNSSALLINSKQFSVAHGDSFIKTILIFSLSDSSTLLVNANIAQHLSEKMNHLIKVSLLSTFYDSLIIISPFSSLDFEVDISKSSFKLNKSISGTLRLEGPNKEYLMMAKSIRKFDPLDKKGASIIALKAISTIEYVNLINSKEIEIDEMSGYQITANIKIKESGKPMKAIQIILFTRDSYYVFITFVNLEEQKLVNDFEYISSTFKRK